MSSGLWARQPIVEVSHWLQKKRSCAGIRRKVKEIWVSEVSLEKGNACVIVYGYASCQGAEVFRNSSWLGDRVAGGCCEGAREEGFARHNKPFPALMGIVPI